MNDFDRQKCSFHVFLAHFAVLVILFQKETMNRSTPYQRSPTRRRHAIDQSGNEGRYNRQAKHAWKFFPHLFVTLLVSLFVSMIKSNENKTSIRGGATPSAGVSTGRKPSLHLLGERHSGTKWMTEHLTECFGEEIEIRKGFSAWKHWFQKENPAVESAVVVIQFRNPFYWVEAMNRFPHHSPEHFDLDWETFVTKPWTMPRYGKDLKFDGNIDGMHEDVKCHNSPSFGPNEIIPCIANCTIVQEMPSEKGRRVIDAFYELRHDGSGQPYQSILELRGDKIKNFLQVAEFSNVLDSFVVQYDDMVSEGTELLISSLERTLGVSARCIPQKGTESPRRPLEKRFVEYLLEHIDWDAEALIGFTPRDY